MIYEIINPSDSYTIKGDLKPVAIATCLLGSGKYGLDAESHKEEDGMPIFIFGGHDEWFTEKFGQSFEEAISSTPRTELANVLDTVLIGKLCDRHAYELGLSLIDDPAKREQWWAEWHDERRSSMNDIGGRAKAYAKRFREQPALQE